MLVKYFCRLRSPIVSKAPRINAGTASQPSDKADEQVEGSHSTSLDAVGIFMIISRVQYKLGSVDQGRVINTKCIDFSLRCSFIAFNFRFLES